MEDDVTLKEYFLSLMNGQRRAFDAALASQDKLTSAALAASNLATEKAEATAEKWRVNANEWRGAMDDRESKFVSVEVHRSDMDGLRKEVANLKDYVSERKGGEAGMKSAWGWIAGGLAALMAVVTIASTIIVIVSR